MKSAFLFLNPLVSFAATVPTDRDGDGIGNLFPKPDPVLAFSEMKMLSTSGAVWRRPLEDWDGARHRLAADAAWAQWLAAQQAEVDDWMVHQHDRVEWIAGWWHDFVSPKDGSFLTWTPTVPGEGVKFLSSVSDPRVEITPKIFRAWVGIFRGRNITMVERAALLWRLTGDPRYARWASEQLDIYAHNL